MSVLRPWYDTGNINTNNVQHNNLDVIKPVPERQELTISMIVCCLNVRSVNKAMYVADLVLARHIDVLAMIETWLGTVIDK